MIINNSSRECRHPKVFISYSHDSIDHDDQILQLANRLRKEGIDVLIDQYEPAPSIGWPMWMEREIQKADFVILVCTKMYLRRFEGREEPGKGRGVLWEAKLIYNDLYKVDADVQRYIPILFRDGNISNIPIPLQGLTHYLVNTEEGFEGLYRHLTGQLGCEKPDIGKLKALPELTPQSYPASFLVRKERKFHLSLDKRNRMQILKRVRLDWVDGVLNKSLYKVARIELGMKVKSDAVEQPLNAIVQIQDESPISLPPGTVISKIFNDHGGALLILGAPGTGKTTFLLELARDLLDSAEKDENYPLPVVFNLSSWAIKQQSLDKWLADELNERSDVPKKLSSYLVETEQIVPLLDGLDEVSPPYRNACVAAINNFRRNHGLLPIAVCSRIADYESLSGKLRLRSAIVVQPLSKQQIWNYLEKIGEPVKALRTAFNRDMQFSALLESPLMLWIAILTYQDTQAEFFQDDTVEQRQRRLFENFVENMFRRRSKEIRYTQTDTISWLSWLAAIMIRNNQTVFHLEDLQTSLQLTEKLITKWLLNVGIAIIIGFIFGSIFGLIFNLVVGLIVGSVVGIVTTLTKLRPIDTIRFSPTNILSRIGKSLGYGISIWLIFWVIVYLIGSIYVRLRYGGELFLGRPPAEIIILLFFGIIAGIIGGLIKLLYVEVVDIRIRPNQGTYRSLKMGLSAFLIFGLIFGSILLLLPIGPYALIGGLIIGMIAGLIAGGLFCIWHLAIRLILWISHLTPFNYVRFLDYSAGRLFLYKIGGGYIFVHRFLQEYFASLKGKII